ncbi:Uu.00g121640.m01.CDS01 [Anthostomella pinea]|uniref:Uu.00g121640.m01.CDS01 n=1 Tax=Anthostomella pinea TaxID=933095 RepID=A0AAI8YH86_9PEZI|nr:Uu.00g121640.m01.CDS01 [Anthostomella pinea]
MSVARTLLCTNWTKYHHVSTNGDDDDTQFLHKYIQYPPSFLVFCAHFFKVGVETSLAEMYRTQIQRRLDRVYSDLGPNERPFLEQQANYFVDMRKLGEAILGQFAVYWDMQANPGPQTLQAPRFSLRPGRGRYPEGLATGPEELQFRGGPWVSDDKGTVAWSYNVHVGLWPQLTTIISQLSLCDDPSLFPWCYFPQPPAQTQDMLLAPPQSTMSTGTAQLMDLDGPVGPLPPPRNPLVALPQSLDMQTLDLQIMQSLDMQSLDMQQLRGINPGADLTPTPVSQAYSDGQAANGASAPAAAVPDVYDSTPYPQESFANLPKTYGEHVQLEDMVSLDLMLPLDPLPPQITEDVMPSNHEHGGDQVGSGEDDTGFLNAAAVPDVYKSMSDPQEFFANGPEPYGEYVQLGDMVNLDMVDHDMVDHDMVNLDMVNLDMVNFDMVDPDMVNLPLDPLPPQITEHATPAIPEHGGDWDGGDEDHTDVIDAAHSVLDEIGW